MNEIEAAIAESRRRVAALCGKSGPLDRVVLEQIDRLLVAYGEVVDKNEELRARVEVLEGDVVAAAGELLVPMPSPGTEMARVLRANVLLRHERDQLQRRVADLTTALALHIADAPGQAS